MCVHTMIDKTNMDTTTMTDEQLSPHKFIYL